MKSMTIIALCAACFSASTYANTFTDLFDGVTIGGGYASDSAEGSTLGGYSVYSQGTLFPSLKDYLFTDFRYTTTSKEDYWLDPSSNLIKQDVDLNRYQASLGLGYPCQVSESVVLKPYATAGWSWDKRNQAMTDSITFGFSNAEWSLQAALTERNRYRVASNTDQE